MFFSSNTAIVEQKRTHRAKALAGASSYSEEHGHYIQATAPQIVANIESGKWTASQVLEAYIARAAFTHAKTNCATEVLFDEARRRAKELDDEFAATKTLKGPLHGVPFSVKDHVNVAGYDSCTGYSQWTNQPATEDAHFVGLLRAAGAIPIVKTNVPQTMMAFECSNPVWGRTTNPWNERYTCGGSSGGEGAILAMDGTAFGIGSDIGGSLRIPASYCGIYSFKPSHGRICSDGARAPCAGFESISTVLGPMARSVADLDLICRTVFGVQGLTHSIPPLPYREATLPSKLRFGYYTSDGYVKASPANKRAVLETVEALRKQGHECVEFHLPDTGAMNIFVGLVTADGYKKLVSHLGPDKKEDILFLVMLGPRLPGFLRRFAAWIAETFAHDSVFANTMRQAYEKDVTSYYDVIEARQQFTRVFYREVWEKYNFDGIISPVQAVPTLRHGDCATLSPLAAATVLYNVVDSPVGTIPVTRVDPAKDALTEEWSTGPGRGSALFERALYHARDAVYDPVLMSGIPVGVQIAGRKWEDEKVLKMMRVVDDALGPRGFGPGMWKEKVG